MLLKNWLFYSPDGAAGRDGAATGVTPADAGQTPESRLEQLSKS